MCGTFLVAPMRQGYYWHLRGRARAAAVSYSAQGPPHYRDEPIQNVRRWLRRKTIPGGLLGRALSQTKKTCKKAGSVPFKIKYPPPLSHTGKQVSFYFSLWGGFLSVGLTFWQKPDASQTAECGLLCIRKRIPRAMDMARHTALSPGAALRPLKLTYPQLCPPMQGD